MSWRDRLVEQPELRSLDHWHLPSADSLPAGQRPTYLRNLRLIAAVLAGQASLQTVARAHSVSPGRLSQLLDRCLGGDADAPPALARGLIPYHQLGPARRVRPLATLQSPTGASCAFRALLEQVPGLKAGLEACLEAALREQPNAQRLTPQAFHGEFKRLLAEAHWPRDRYPYTEASLASESCRRYYHQRRDEWLRGRQQRQKCARYTSPIHRTYLRALRDVQIDEHKTDVRGSLYLEIEEQLIHLPLSCVTLLLAVDVASDCILGYYLAPSPAPNQDDLLTLLDRCLHPWRLPEVNIPSLSYAPGAGFPSTRVPVSPHYLIGTLHMDNAWMHKAASVRSLITEQLGAVMHFGLPGTPKMRALVETMFRYITTHCTHRMPSTTGSHPKDPVREARKNRKRTPILTFQMLDDAFCVLLAEYNVTPSAVNGGLSPMERYLELCQQHYIPFATDIVARQWHSFLASETVTVHTRRDSPGSPYINFCYARYHGEGLAKVPARQPKILVSYNRKDIRSVDAFTLDGTPLGPLQVEARWRRYPHGKLTRSYVHKKVRQHRFHARDPLAAFFADLLNQRHSPKHALQILKYYKEFTSDGMHAVILPDAQSAPEHAPASPQEPYRYRWNPELAAHRSEP